MVFEKADHRLETGVIAVPAEAVRPRRFGNALAAGSILRDVRERTEQAKNKFVTCAAIMVRKGPSEVVTKETPVWDAFAN